MPDYIKEAKRAKRERDYSKAGDLFYLGGDEKSAMDCYLQGNHFSLAARLLEKSEDWRGAAKFYSQAGKFNDAAEIYCNRLKDYQSASLMFEKQGDLSRASDMAEKAGDIGRAALIADQAELWERAAGLWVQVNKYERAADIYYKLLKQLDSEKQEKGFLESYQSSLQRYGNAAGTLYSRLKRWDRAAESYSEAENFAKTAECYVLAGMPEKAAEVYYIMQQYDRAYELLIHLGENCQDRKLFGDVCFGLKRYQEAGDLYLLAEKTTRAAEAYEAASNLYKAALLYESIEDYTHAAEIYIKANETQKAAQLYEKAKKYDYAAMLYLDAGSVDKAVECLKMADQRVQAAKFLIQRNDPQQAIAILQEIPAEHEQYLEACVLLGQLFTNMEMHSVALQKLLAATRDQPISTDNLDIYYALAISYEKANQYSKAREVFEKILSIQLGYKDVFWHLQSIKKSNLADGTTRETTASIRLIVARRYKLLEKMGTDAFGTMYKGQDLSLDRQVIIRRLPEQENFAQNILEQTRNLSTLVHSNIQTIYDSGKDENFYFVCLEYPDGVPLRQALSRGPIDISDICEMASQICVALAYAHKKAVLYRHLTPENLYMCTGNQIKLINFGFEPKPDKTGALLPKQYMSPEQFLGQKIDGRSDLYALGVVLFEMIYAVPPFSGADVEDQHMKKLPVFPENAFRPVPAFLLKIVQKCLNKDRNLRYPNADEILAELEVADLGPGLVVNQRYEILEELGSGGMGHVYKAKDRDLDETVALKVLRAEVSADPIIQKRFLRELKVSRMITHPNVVKVFDTGKYKGNRFISMEFIEGTSLDDWLKENRRADLDTLLTVLYKILNGLQAAHDQGIVHRDLKPQNVLLDRSLNPKVLDFGIARSKDPVDATSSGQVLGSPKYMSPEQVQGKDLDSRSDIYSIGVLMFYMFAGREPFVGDESRAIIMKHLTEHPPTMTEINPDVPKWLEPIVARALEKDRNQRYSSLREIMEDLRKGYERS